jgi:hypothetical protein
VPSRDGGVLVLFRPFDDGTGEARGL